MYIMQSVDVAFCFMLILCSAVALVTGHKNTPAAKKEKSFINPVYPHIKQSKGLDVTLQCIISSSNATGIIWTRNGSRVKNDSRHTATEVIKSNKKDRFSNLKIQSIEASDYGVYKCHANVSGKVSSASINLSEKKIPPPPIKPKETKTPNTTIKVSLKSNVLLKCYLATSASSINWLKNGTKVKIDKRHSISSSSNETKLEIKSVEANDFGIYECIVNVSGKVQSPKIELVEKKETPSANSARVNLPEKKIPPTSIKPIKEPNTTIKVSLKSDVFLKCHLNASAASIKWLKNGTKVKIDKRHNISSSSNETKLEIKSVEGDDFGTYECIVNISGKVQSAKIELVENKQTPSMKTTRDELEVPLKGNVTLKCDFSKPSSSSYTWWKGDTKLNNDKRHTIKEYFTGNTTTGTSLDIASLETGDYGVYKCQTDIFNEILFANFKLVQKKS